MSAIDGDLVAARAGDADHDRVLALVFGEHEVAVIGFAGQQSCPTSAAGPGFAGTRHPKAVLAQNFEDCRAGRNVEHRAGARETYLERLVIWLVRLGFAERFEMH